MNSYEIKPSAKTKVLNAFRKIFTVPAFERVLVSQVINSKGSILQKLIPPDYLYPLGSSRRTKRNGIQFDLDISHVVDHAIYYGYPEEGMKQMEPVIKNAKTIVDIGANIGATALHFARLNPQAKVFAFEPHPKTFGRATRNIGLNPFNNIQLINLGLGAKKETVRLYEVNEHNPGMNRILSTVEDKPFVEIKIETLDQVLANNGVAKVDFIKIDVEGYELSVLRGATNTLAAHPVLFIELDDENLRDQGGSAAELIRLLETSGYKEFSEAGTDRKLSSSSDFSHCHFDLIAR